MKIFQSSLKFSIMKKHKIKNILEEKKGCWDSLQTLEDNMHPKKQKITLNKKWKLKTKEIKLISNKKKNIQGLAKSQGKSDQEAKSRQKEKNQRKRLAS